MMQIECIVYKISDFNPTIPIITLQENGLNTSRAKKKKHKNKKILQGQILYDRF